MIQTGTSDCKRLSSREVIGMRQTGFDEREARIVKRSRLITSRLLAGLLVALVVIPVAGAQSWKPSATEPFSPPTGPFAVGTHEYLWIDRNRAEPFTKDPADRRRLLARVWYPAEANGQETARYVFDANEFPEKSIYRQGYNVKTHSVTDAPLAKSKGDFPVLIYQPGGGTAFYRIKRVR